MSSIVSGLFSGRSGIQAHGTAIAVLADNIANQNTVGFKTGRADFVDLLAGSIGGGGSGALSTGSGSAVKRITRVLAQGVFEPTGRGLDLAIDGNGFLVVQDRAGVTYYTRAGNLSVDPDGNLLDQNGHFVLGYAANGSGAIEKMNVNQRVATDIQTSGAYAAGNLDARQDLTVTAASLGDDVSYMDLNNADAFSMPINVFDSLGGTHTLRVSFFKTGSNTWEAAVYADGSEVTGGTPGQARRLATIDLVFDPNGQLTVPTNAIGSITPPWNNGSDPTNTIDIDLSKFTQFATNSSLESLSQNGIGSGSVVGYSVRPNGDLIAQLDNGQSAVIGTIALATFANSEGLQRVGNSLFAASADSGEPIIGAPGIGTFGTIASGALELSTADMASDFIKLISLQRGFQGSSRVIGSISDLLNEVVNLAR